MKNIDDPDENNVPKKADNAAEKGENVPKKADNATEKGERPPWRTAEYAAWSLGDKANRSGRPPGAQNSVTYIRKRLKELGFDWVAEAVKRYNDPKTPQQSKDYTLNLIVSRLAPTLKSMEIKDTTEKAVLPPQFNIVAIPVPNLEAQNDLVTITHEPSINHSDIVSNTIDNDNGTIDDSP